LRWESRYFRLNWPWTETRGSLFFILTLYWDERVINFGLNWPCTETRGSLFFILTLYWDERVVKIDFWTDHEVEGHLSESETVHQRVITCIWDLESEGHFLNWPYTRGSYIWIWDLETEGHNSLSETLK